MLEDLIVFFLVEQLSRGFILRATGPAGDGLSRWLWVEEELKGPIVQLIRPTRFSLHLPEDDLTQAAAQALVHFVNDYTKGRGTITRIDYADGFLRNMEYLDLRQVSFNFFLSLRRFLYLFWPFSRSLCLHLLTGFDFTHAVSLWMLQSRNDANKFQER